MSCAVWCIKGHACLFTITPARRQIPPLLLPSTTTPRNDLACRSTPASFFSSTLARGLMCKTTCQTKKSSRGPACPPQSFLLPVQLRWACHVTGMADVRMPKELFFSELQERKRDRGAPRKRYKDQLKRQLAQARIRQQESSDRDSSRSSVRKASCKFEAERHKATKEKRRRQRERAAFLPPSTQTFVCPECSRVCASRIGLYSHQRAYKI